MMGNCTACGEAKHNWEVRCAQCVISSDIPDDWPILLVGLSLRYRLVVFFESVGGALVVGTAVYLAVAPVLQLLSRVLSGTALTISQIVWFLLVVILIIGCVTAVYLGYSQLKSNAFYEVSKTKIKFSNIIESYESMEDEIAGAPPIDTRFVKNDLPLKKVRSINVKQGWLARHLSYGEIEIFLDQGGNPWAVIPGVTDPFAFKEKLELIVRYGVSASVLPTQGPRSNPQKP
jgi:hypothetical protein